MSTGQSTAGPARQDNLRHARHPKRLNGSGLTPRGRARGAVGSGHPVGAPRRLHVPYPERRGAARTRSARERDRHRRILPRLHQERRRGMREPRLRRVAARRARPVRALDGLRGRPLPRSRGCGMGRHGAAPSRDGGAPARLHRRLEHHRRVLRGRRAAARERARVQRGQRHRGGPGRSAGAADAQPRMDCAGVGRWFVVRDHVAPCRPGGHREAGDALAPPASARRAEPPRGAASGGARGAQPAGARHPRHADPGLRRHPDAAAGGAAVDDVAAAEGGRGARNRRGPRAVAHGGSAALGRRAPSRRDRRGIAARRAAAHRRDHAAHHRDPDSAHHQRAAARARAGARHCRHRPGSAHQRRAPLARPGDRRQRVRGTGRSACGCRSRTTAAALPASSARAGSA